MSDAIFKGSKRSLGLSWGSRGHDHDQLLDFSGSLGTLLGLSWDSLGGLREPLGTLLGALGLSWGPSEVSWAPRWAQEASKSSPDPKKGVFEKVVFV